MVSEVSLVFGGSLDDARSFPVANIFIYMYVCICVCICICIYMYVYIHASCSKEVDYKWKKLLFHLIVVEKIVIVDILKTASFLIDFVPSSF